jgi:hypothetical protein
MPKFVVISCKFIICCYESVVRRSRAHLDQLLDTFCQMIIWDCLFKVPLLCHPAWPCLFVCVSGWTISYYSHIFSHFCHNIVNPMKMNKVMVSTASFFVTLVVILCPQTPCHSQRGFTPGLLGVGGGGTLPQRIALGGRGFSTDYLDPIGKVPAMSLEWGFSGSNWLVHKRSQNHWPKARVVGIFSDHNGKLNPLPYWWQNILPNQETC